MLSSGCHVSKFFVFPKDWQKSSTLKTIWNIRHRFFDSQYKQKFPFGKLVIVKRMNMCKSILEKGAVTKSILNDEINKIVVLDYSPIMGIMLERETGAITK